MKQNTFSSPLSLAVSVLFGAMIGAAAMNSSQATAETPDRARAVASASAADTVYLPGLFTEAQRGAAEQPLPAQF